MNKSKRFRIENLIFLTLVVVSIVVMCVSAKITFVSMDMFILRDNITDYNENALKTDETGAYYSENANERDKNFYNSEDALVRVFSNQNIVVKLIGAAVATALFLGIPSVWIYCIVKVMKTTGTRRHRRRTPTRSRMAHM